VAAEGDGDELLVRDLEDALHLPVRGLLERAVDLGRGRVLAELHRDVHEGDVRGGDADGDAVELALQLGDGEVDGLGRAGRGRDHGERRRPRAPQVLVGQVQDLLSLVYECTVVIWPFTIPNVSWRTLATGPRQFVVHEA